MFVIILNCVTLGMYQPCNDEACVTTRCQILQGFDNFIFAFFAIEMIIKMVAMGVWGKDTYLADSWNRLDCFIVVAGTIEYAVDTENLSLSAIRTIRVLRPLRAINRIPSMRILVMLLLDTLPMLGNVLLLCFFVFFIFGIIGVQLWSGVLRNRCFLQPPDKMHVPDYVEKYYTPKHVLNKNEYICSKHNESGMNKCENLPLYIYEGITCNASAKEGNNTPTNQSCVDWNQYYTKCEPHGNNPFMGAVSFDNIGLAWVAIFQVISLESWVNIMYFVQDAHSFWDWIYFVALIVIGSFFMINLCLVVIATQFSETKKRETERMMQERKRFQSCSTLASNSEPGGCYSELLKLVAQVYRRVKRKVIKAYYRTRGLQKINPEKSLSLRRKKSKKKGTNNLQSQLHCSSIVRQHSLSHAQPVHHHQHQHLLPPSSPQPPQPTHLHHVNLVTPDVRYQSPPRPSSTPQAPRASPEQSDIDSMSSPRRPNYLVLPSSNYSLNPSSESLAISHLSVDPFTPVLFKSQQNSPNHLSANFSFTIPFLLNRTSSFNSGASAPGKILPSLPEVLAAQGAKNAVLAASNMLLNVDYELSKTQSLADKGLFADNLLMDMVGDKQLTTQMSMQSETEVFQLSQGQAQTDQDTTSCGGSGGVGTGDKELAGEYGNSSCNPSGIIVAGGDTVDSDVDTSKAESGVSMRSSNICEILNCLQKKLKTFVESNFFQRSILIAILLNTLSMGIEHHEQHELLTLTLEYSNIVFCVLFGAEMAFKICAYGLFGYISNGFNVFDGFIVILSIVELAQQGGTSGLSVLRTFRLLRILKLVRFMPALRRQLVVMLRTMDNVATFFALLVLFMFIFSILGMSLFGGTFCEKEDGKPCSCMERRNTSLCRCDRANFDNLLWSLVTVFQVLTQEDWNTVLYNGMAKTSAWASLYFVALMTFGNYVLFNLLVAILVEGFSTEDEDKKKKKEKEEIDKDVEDEEEKEKQRLAENNNIDDAQSAKICFNAADIDVKNNKEKEKKMLALPPTCGISIKNETPSQLQAVVHSDGPLNPPIITHTAATPMATPQGSPNENAIKDTNNKLSLSVKRSALKSTLSVDSDKSPNFRGGSPRPSPCLRRTNSRGSHHQRSASWRARNRRLRGDKTSLVVDSLSDSADDVDDDVFSSSHSQSPTYSAGTPRTPSVNTHGHAVTYVFSDCNGHPPLNNQRALSPQNSLKGRALTPRNSFKSHHTWSRNNSVGSGRSICNSFELSRQNSFTSHRTLNSLGSGNSKDDNKSNKNFVDLPDVKIALDKEEGREEESDLPDPDAIDETEWNWSWCPEPKGCFLDRHEYTFYLLSNENRLRKFTHQLISKKWFDNAVLIFIALNCITLAMERPSIPPYSVERFFLTYSNYVFTFVFTLEMMIKVIAKGFFIGKHAYLKSGWNVMDGFLVIISLIDILISISASSVTRIFGILRVFRLLRTLRPLRVISRAPGLKLVVQTLLSSLRPIGNIVLICCTFFIIFGILGVQLFKGQFYYCHGKNVKHITNKTQCKAENNDWRNQKYNFDNLGQALMALFVLASKDGWVQIMYTGLDAVGVDQQPIENYNEWRLLYFISFLLLVAFFVLNMFVGVVVENFHKCRESQEIEERAKRAAKRQEKLDKKRKSEAPKASSEMREPPYWANYTHSRLFIHTVINSKYFDLAIAAVIGLNVITMAMEYYMMPPELEHALKIFNFFFTSVFILEAAMKIIALGFLRFIKDRWNQLDIMIVVLSIVGIVMEEMKANVIQMNPTIIRVMRVLRIARVLKLLKMAKGIRALLDTVIQALPQVGNLGLLFFLLFFIFAALGVELFGRLECSDSNPCEGLSEHAHFQNFGMAFLTLFRVATGDNWNGIMKDTLRVNCDSSDTCLTNCCVSSIIAPIYFVVFVLMAQFVLVNVVVAVLMKHLEETYKYKELDDELEDELRAEMCALALAGKAGPDGIEIKESHRMMDDDTILIRDALITITKSNEDPESKESGLEEDNPGGLHVSTLPSFTFSVRPPSEEQSKSEDAPGISPVNASITIEGMGSSWSSMDSNRLAVTPSLTGSSPSSERSVRISSPPIRRAHSPYLLNLQGSSGSIQRRPLVKQYSMDVGSDPQLNNMNTSMPDVWDKFKETHKVICNSDNGISRSQPSLKDIKNDSLDGKSGGSLDSKDGAVPGERMPARDRIKHKLLRSRSSGAKYSRFRDKYKQSNLNKASNHITSDGSLSKEKLKKSNQTGSNETGSDIDESLCSDWGSEEAACDLEVKMITGGTEDEEDDIHPTLSPYVSEDRDSAHLATCKTMVESAASSTHSTSRGDSTPRVMKPPYPKCKSPMPPSLQSPRNNPGIDNTSFELGEDVRLPPCCKARETAVVRRSNSFSSSKLIPKAFSPPRTGSSRSDRALSPYGFREHTTSVSPLALPPSPLALEDSAYKQRSFDATRDISPLSFSHSHMLTVPSPHSLYSNPHMRSPSPTPPKHVHLIPPNADSQFGVRRQPKGSPAPIRRQQTLTRSSAVEHDNFAPAGSSPLRRRIPHTLSMDSAFLVPPGFTHSYSINEPYMELHAGCRATSPLPSPRNSQQTLPGMFTRSASPLPQHTMSPSHQPSQPYHHPYQCPDRSTTETSPEAAFECLSVPIPSLTAKSNDTTPTNSEEHVSTSSTTNKELNENSRPQNLNAEDNNQKEGGNKSVEDSKSNV
ncbi:voltage-dependent T-type calcium channel subunit alpha-1G-like isoform X5 [Physella acuta]|uniref:voltage-dependent T-type calcium channel subunit alpha-1G-like isoform X5 n=1 Tax=Physella acuta TaxID=109671 RepID=UPI0027DB794A|nr:voltage-dependent T-type calcium channel subunit alpha-1G-like isoform X5 [Physella acuta]